MDIANDRKDCVAFISPARADVVDVANAVTQTQNVIGFADGLSSTSYAVIDLSLIHISEPTRHAQISYTVF